LKNTKFGILLFFFLCLCICTLGCIDEIDYSENSQSKGINISGQLTNVLEEQKVVIREVLDLNASSSVVGDPIEDASVQIEDSEGQIKQLPYNGKGEYTRVMQGRSGDSYKLKVTTSDGQSYESNMIKMSRLVPMENLSAQLIDITVKQNNGIITTIPKMLYKVSSTLHDGTSPVYSIYRALGQYEFAETQTSFGNAIEDSKVCYISESNDLGNVVTLSGFDLPNGKVSEREIFNIDYDFRFQLNYCLHLEQYIIDKETYSYWNKVEQLVKETSLFDPPPGRIYSNIKPTDNTNEIEVRGYFTVAGKSDIRTFVNAKMLERPVENICRALIRAGQINNSDLPPFCSDCLKARNSTLEKPTYWPE
jgi:hypothetical protein